MTSYTSNYFANAALAAFFGSGTHTYMSLHTSDPGVGGTLSTEIAGGSYVRQRTLWSSPNSKTIATTNAQIFSNLPASVITYVGIWDAVSNGHLMFRFGIPGQTVIASGQFFAAAGDVAFSL